MIISNYIIKTSEKIPDNNIIFIPMKSNFTFYGYISEAQLFLFIIYHIFWINLDIIRHFWKILTYELNWNKSHLFSLILKQLLLLKDILRQQTRNTYQYDNKVITMAIKNRYSFNLKMILKITFSFSMICLIIPKLLKRNRHMLVVKQRVNFSKNEKTSRIVTRLHKNDYTWMDAFSCDNESINQGRSYIDSNINVSDCFFSRLSSYSGSGGVVYVNGGSYSMIFNSSMFFNCICSSLGGAMYFSSQNSFLRMICANRCSCGNLNSYHFVYIQTPHMNQVNYLSVSYCSPSTFGSYSIRLDSGNQSVSNTNSSMNNANSYSGLYLSSTSSSTSSHCTFSNNKVSDFGCLRFYSALGTMLYANILNNNSPSGNGVVYVDGGATRKMMYCIFNSNLNYLFCIYSGSLEVCHSFFDHSSIAFSSRSNVSTANNNSFSYRMTYQIQFFSSLHCNADMPILERTINQTISIDDTINITFEYTLRVTSEKTIHQTIRNTPINTFKEILNNTIPRTYDVFICTHQMVNKRETYVIFSIFFLV